MLQHRNVPQLMMITKMIDDELLLYVFLPFRNHVCTHVNYTTNNEIYKFDNETDNGHHGTAAAAAISASVSSSARPASTLMSVSCRYDRGLQGTLLHIDPSKWLHPC